MLRGLPQSESFGEKSSWMNLAQILVVGFCVSFVLSTCWAEPSSPNLHPRDSLSSPDSCSAKGAQREEDKEATKKASSTKKSKRKLTKRELRKLRKNRREYSFLPATDYSTDKGLGLGVVGMIAQFREGFYPYQWRIFFIGRATLAIDSEGAFGAPFHEYKFKFDLPGLMDQKLRLKGEIGFYRFITTGYFGLGNNTNFDPSQTSKYYQYDRIYPKASLDAQVFLWRKGTQSISLFFGALFHYNIINIFPGSQLDKDLFRARNQKDKVGAYVNTTLRGLAPHALLKLKAGVLIDTRDHEFDPSRGMFHEISVRGSPGIGTSLYFLGFHANTKFYIPIYKRYLQLAIRLVGDVLVGNVPLYELSLYGAFEEEGGPGGGDSVRGLPSQRLHGKAKVIGNVEIRSMFLPFGFFNQRFLLGLTAFLDMGRVWLDYNFPSEEVRNALDGADFRLHMGVGGGIRVRWGETFLIRFDLAYTPTDPPGRPPFRFYFTLGHLF